MEDHNWQNKSNTIENFKQELIQPITQLTPKQADYKNYSSQVSNANRKTQFSLGTYKGVKKTEASTHFKQHEVPKETIPVPNISEVKKHHFTLGSYTNPYITTASTSFVSHGQQEAKNTTKTYSNNICFGGDKVKMTSIGHSEFNHKKVENISQEDMGKIKENHRSSHFTVGNIEPSYMTTNKEYRASTASENKRFAPDTTPHVVFGNYKASHTTEKQESYIKMPIQPTNNEGIGTENRKSHLFMGKEKSASLPTSLEFYQGKQQQENVKFFSKDYSTNINLGSSSRKWESSYQQNFSTRSITPYQQSKPKNQSNVIFGCWIERGCSTTAQESFRGQKAVETSFHENIKNNSFSLGDFKRKFETSNNLYGKNEGKPSRIDEETLKNITDCHFSYGNCKVEIKSKFQDDYGKVPLLPEKFDLKSNPNNKSNLSFGEKQANWESTYKKAFLKRK